MFSQLPEESDRRILIVDDEEAIRGIFTASLSRQYTCVTAADAAEALNILGKQQFALVITDIQMPGLSGIELLRKILADFPNVAVVIVSGIDRSQRVIDALRLGAYDYLIKPCDLDVLQLCVARALERRAILRDGKKYKQDLERRNEELAAQKEELGRLQAQLVHGNRRDHSIALAVLPFRSHRAEENLWRLTARRLLRGATKSGVDERFEEIKQLATLDYVN